MADYISQFTGSEIDQRLAKVSQLETSKQDKLISGTNIKTINGQSVLGGGDITVQAGDTDAVKYVPQTLTEQQKAQARTNIGADSGVGFDDVTSQQDGTIVIGLTNGDTITIDLNHNHTQYPKYVYCSSQAAYDAITTKESDTLYLILETSS